MLKEEREREKERKGYSKNLRKMISTTTGSKKRGKESPL
jgi:hypothetical protein